MAETLTSQMSSGMAPEGWNIVRLGEVVASRKEPVNPRKESELPYVGLEHIDSGQINLARWGKSAEVSSLKNRFFKNDILYGKLRPYLDKSVIAPVAGICSTDIIVLKPSEAVIPEYIAQVLHTLAFISFANSTTTGINHPRTSWSAIQDFTFPLPSIEEQRQIVYLLSVVRKAQQATQEVIRLVESMKNTVFSELLTAEPMDIQEFGGLIAELKHGIYKPSQKIQSGVRILKMGIHFANDRISSQKMERVKITKEELERFSIKVNDLMFARTSMMKDGAGKCSIVVPHDDPIIFDGNLLCVRLKPDVDPLFYFYYFNSHQAKQSFASITAGTQLRNISSSNLSRLQVPVPPLKVQDRISKIMAVLDTKLETENERLSQLREFFKSLMHELLTGKIRSSHLGS